MPKVWDQLHFWIIGEPLFATWLTQSRSQASSPIAISQFRARTRKFMDKPTLKRQLRAVAVKTGELKLHADAKRLGFPGPSEFADLLAELDCGCENRDAIDGAQQALIREFLQRGSFDGMALEQIWSAIDEGRKLAMARVTKLPAYRWLLAQPGVVSASAKLGQCLPMPGTPARTMLSEAAVLQALVPMSEREVLCFLGEAYAEQLRAEGALATEIEQYQRPEGRAGALAAEIRWFCNLHPAAYLRPVAAAFRSYLYIVKSIRIEQLIADYDDVERAAEQFAASLESASRTGFEATRLTSDLLREVLKVVRQQQRVLKTTLAAQRTELLQRLKSKPTNRRRVLIIDMAEGFRALRCNPTPTVLHELGSVMDTKLQVREVKGFLRQAVFLA